VISTLRRLLYTSLSAAAAAGALGGCDESVESAPRSIAAEVPPAASAEQAEVSPRLLRRFQPVAATLPDVPAGRVALGRRLFEDERLSSDGKTSCATCHRLDGFGVDGTAVSRGSHGVLGRRNTPSVFNAGGAFRLMWDGRAGDLEAQVAFPFLGTAEMGMRSMEAVLAVIRADAKYTADFETAFPGTTPAVSGDHVAVALGDFERTLVTRGRWDRYLEGDVDALSPAEKQGLRTFLNAGCMVCHTGKNLGGLTFERAGVVAPWPNQTDRGRAELTREAADDMVFRVPSLRNVAETAPYFHDGSVARLEEAVAVMGRHQLGLELSTDETSSIALWLRSLTGTPVGRLAEPPAATVTPARAPAAPCGAVGAPPCPLQAWMRGNARPSLERADFGALTGTFTAIAAIAPAGFPGWSAFAHDGKRAAAMQSIDDVRAACEGCHVALRERYRTEQRARPLVQ
jgi:cytochrome c peroxidase